MKIEYLDLENLIDMVDQLGLEGIRDLGLLDSAAYRPQVMVMGQDAYPSIHGKAAVLLESIVRNHPLIDGNKRLGWMATYNFYGLNNSLLDAPDDEAYELVIAVTTGSMNYLEAAKSFEQWTSL